MAAAAVRTTKAAPMLLAGAMLAANAVHYLFTVVQSRLLGPPAYGALGALLGLVLLGAVPGYALQAVTARRTALGSSGDQVWASMLRGVVAVGATLGLAAALGAPMLARFLHLDSMTPVLVLAACLVPLPLLSVLHGLLQGRRRWAALAAVLVTGALVKLVAGVGLVLAGRGVTGALAGAAVGYAVEAGLALWLVRPTWAPGSTPPPAEVLTAAVGILGLWLLINADVVLARHLLPAVDSGRYAVGSVTAKVAFWACQPVAVVAFPLLVMTGNPRRLLARAARPIILVGGGLTLCAAVAGPGLLPLVFGPAYAPVAPFLWAFALLGTLFALVQLVLYAELARGRGHRLLPAAAAVEASLLLALADSVAAILSTAVLIAAVTLALLLRGWRG